MLELKKCFHNLAFCIEKSVKMEWQTNILLQWRAPVQLPAHKLVSGARTNIWSNKHFTGNTPSVRKKTNIYFRLAQPTGKSMQHFIYHGIKVSHWLIYAWGFTNFQIKRNHTWPTYPPDLLSTWPNYQLTSYHPTHLTYLPSTHVTHPPWWAPWAER